MQSIYKILSNWFLSRPRITGFLFFLFLLFLSALLVKQRHELFLENEEKKVENLLHETDKNIDRFLSNNYTSALTLALSIDEKQGKEVFEQVAKSLLQSNQQLSAVELSPAGKTTLIYPQSYVIDRLGKDVFAKGEDSLMHVQTAIRNKRMYYEGPVKHGDEWIIIGRLPFFTKNNFWGFSVMISELDVFLKNMGIDNQKLPDYQFQFSLLDDHLREVQHFLPALKKGSIRKEHLIHFAGVSWKLTVVNVNPYNTLVHLTGSIIFGICLVVLSSYLLSRLLIKQADLQQMFSRQGQRLQNTEHKYKQIFDHAAVGIARVNSKGGELLEVNQYICHFFGYTAEELIGKKIKTLIHPDDLAEDSVLFKRFLSGESREVNNEKRYITRNGEIRWANVTLTPLWTANEPPLHHIIIIEDITERKIEEKKLIDSQMRIESLINTIDGIVWEGEASTFEFTFISKKVERVLGYTMDEWLSDPDFWEKHLYPEDHDWVLNFCTHKTAHGQEHDFEYRMVAKDGSIVWLRDIVTVIMEEGKPSKLRGIMIDITKAKEAEKTLNYSFNLVTEQNKRLLNFSYIVSHNLRSHSSNIDGITTLISQSSEEEEREELLLLLKQVNGNLNETLLNLNHVINIQNNVHIEVEMLHLGEYIRRALSILSNQIQQKKIRIINEVNEQLLVSYNKAYLESVLLNLLSNAIRYGGEGKEPEIALTSYQQEDVIVLEVSDNGIGIDLEKHGERIFGMYQTFNGNTDARGYGLYITKHQIEAMEGKIEVESTIGLGTTFKVYFKGKI